MRIFRMSRVSSRPSAEARSKKDEKEPLNPSLGQFNQVPGRQYQRRSLFLSRAPFFLNRKQELLFYFSFFGLRKFISFVSSVNNCLSSFRYWFGGCFVAGRGRVKATATSLSSAGGRTALWEKVWAPFRQGRTRIPASAASHLCTTRRRAISTRFVLLLVYLTNPFSTMLEIEVRNI